MTEKESSIVDFELIEFQKIKDDHAKEVNEMKQNFQQLFNETIKKMLIELNEEKDKMGKLEVKNQSLENGMKILKEEMNEVGR
uniref:Uncharacterized protein n=1 Tax=Meloidogyne hapla TaxID=6305 RepID=A0A1I8BK48_MELHA